MTREGGFRMTEGVGLRMTGKAAGNRQKVSIEDFCNKSYNPPA
jgi:hypothetical protein